MSRARLITYEQVRSEIQAHMDALKTVASEITSDPTEADSFGKGGKKDKKGKKGKGDGKNVKKESQHQNLSPNPNNDAVCWHCGKKEPFEHRMLVESKESVQYQWTSKQRR